MQDKDSIANEEQEADSELVLADDSSELDSDNEDLSSRKQSISKKQAKLLGFRTSFSGPLPPPETLKAYDIIDSGLARRIFDLAERQAEHRMELEKAVVFGDGQRSWTGLILGFVIACLFLGSSTYIIVQGHDFAGGSLASVGLVSLVSVFVYGTNMRAQEREEKRKALLGSDSDE